MKTTLAVNAVLDPEDPSEDPRRLLFRHPDVAAWTWIGLPATRPRRLPTWVDEAELLEGLRSGSLRLADSDAFVLVLPADKVSPSARRTARRNWRILAPLVEDPTGAIFYPAARGPLIKARAVESKVSDRTIYALLRQFWERGQTPDALIPRFDARGGPGKPRSTTSQPAETRSRGVRVTPEIAEKLIEGGEKYYIKAKLGWKAAHRETLREFFVSHTEELFGIQVAVPLPLEQCPTLAQFKYYFGAYLRTHREQALRRRAGRPVYDNVHRPTLHRSSRREDGPGSLYQVDATVADVHLVSALMPGQLIGRPVLYLVRDVFSLMIVGLHVALEGPNWVGMMCALYNAFTSKVDYCARHGLPITEDEWSCDFLCRALLGDAGELLSQDADYLAEALYILVSNAAARQPIWKALIERSFRTVNDETIQFAPGRASLRPFGSRDCRLDAKLTLEDFTLLMILHALNYNNNRILEDRDSIAPGYPAHRLGNPTPRDQWRWGIAQRSGLLRSATQDQVRAALLPHGRATITTRGLKFRGLHYGPADLVRPGGGVPGASPFSAWFLRGVARGDRPRSTNVQFDPRNAGDLLVPTPGSGLPHPFRLIRSDREFAGLTFQEAAHTLKVRREATRAGKAIKHIERAKFEGLRDLIFKAASAGLNGRPILDHTRAARLAERRVRAHSEAWTGGGPRPRSSLSPLERPAPTSSTPDYVPPPDYLNIIEHTRTEVRP